MNSNKQAILLAVSLLASSWQMANATSIELNEWQLAIDQNVYVDGVGLPATVNTSAFNPATGLGSLTVSLSNLPGVHYVAAFFDHEIDEATNTFFNETGTAVGTPPAGLSWEIDEPGYGSSQSGSGGLPYVGDIFTNFISNTLDDRVFYDAFDDQSLTTPDDVSMALGWNFVLAADETATVSFILSTTIPAAGFYLIQGDPDSNIQIYASSTLNIRGGGQPPIPEPATGLLLGIGLAALMSLRKR